jgi:dihydropteroate synthase-like protein
MTGEHIHFVTGCLAEFALRREVADLSQRLGFDYTIDVLPITVAALMTPAWIARHLSCTAAATRVLIPGYCAGDMAPIQETCGVPAERGPKDLRQLGEYLGGVAQERADYGEHTIEIIAEINHAPRLALAEIVSQARKLRADGADVIDVGCDPGEPWSGASDCVKALKDQGLRVSIDSLHPREIAPAVKAGAELVLSVNETNREAARDWGCEVVAIPDDPSALRGLEETVECLALARVPLRIDAILEPIGLGFAASLERYFQVRRKYPDAAMMMGIGNLTEMTEVDSAGVNLLLLAICQELSIGSVLTTQVINWARSCVRECDLARKLVHYAVRHRVPPKHVDRGLVVLRDPKLTPFGAAELDELARQIRDNNYRIYAEDGELHLIGRGLHLRERDPFLLFERLLNPGFGGASDMHEPQQVDASHAFYLGYELAKAVTALALGKQYTQDEALDWGYLSVPEESHRLRKSRASAPAEREEPAP